MPRSGEITNKEIAQRINTHLRRFEADPVINAEIDRQGSKLRPYYHASCVSTGRYVSVGYVSYQHRTSLTKAEALAYLTKLDTGYVGKHFGLGLI